ncbi:hypothetical protein OOT33_03695 [Sphingobium sp. DEHP117]|uniref:hypothetical protein n=1 Tax=Sphingobium sp. DEHP117 TaxID=2993436 RepID=UPI0027D501FF|nr:hypothetical protein [Sphingobium sp. DEHP117]MDQ4419542.1 hypothetical protein [Sphingobium sp. DEHP117]
MIEALADMFATAQAPQIVWEGKPVYAIYEIIPAPNGVIVEFLSATAVPVQGLTLKASGGVLVVNGVEAPEMLLWCDTAPDTVVVQVKQEPGKKVVLKLWNIWRGNMGGVDVTQAWLGNAGMRIECSQGGRELLLRCSDGEGSVDFGDLEARVTIT